MKKFTRIWTRLILSCAIASQLACGAQSGGPKLAIDTAAGDQAPDPASGQTRAERVCSYPGSAESAFIDRQEDLEQLRGCTEIEGLAIDGDRVTDLSPLAELRVVTDALDIEAEDSESSRLRLSGLEHLESVRMLTLSGFVDLDLQALSGLRQVEILYLRGAQQLRDLRALQGVQRLGRTRRRSRCPICLSFATCPR
jgi:hypothetical protein